MRVGPGAHRFAAGVLVAALGACEGVDGDAPGAHGRVEWSAADGTIAVAYIDPPWVATTDAADELELRIPAEVFGVSLDGSPPTHVFRLSHVDALDGLDGVLQAASAASGAGTDSGTGTGIGLDTDGGLGTDGIPPAADPLAGIDLRDPREVALAELLDLVDRRKAQLDEELRVYTTANGLPGVVYQLVVDPGLFVRVYYFQSRTTAVRAAYVSLFQLDTSDIEAMTDTIETRGSAGGGAG